MMITSRRNILTMLGLATATTGALAADDVANQKDAAFPLRDGGRIQLAKYDPERMAIAFEGLAREIRANNVNVSKFHIGTEVIGEDILTQTLTIDLEVLVRESSHSR